MLDSVPYSLGSVALVRRRLVDGLAGRVPEDVVDDAALVVSELVANALRHGAPLSGHSLQVGWDVSADGVRLSVADGGRGPQGGIPDVGFDCEGGRGLFLVDALSGSWGVQPLGAVGSRVWAEMPCLVFAAPA